MPEEVAAKMPEGTECCFVRVDQNLIRWVRGDETGAVETGDRTGSEGTVRTIGMLAVWQRNLN